MQRKSVISSDSDEIQHIDPHLISHQVEQTGSLTPIFALGKLNRMLKTYEDDKVISALDKRLFKGFYVADEGELQNDSEQETFRYMNRCDFGKAKNLLQLVNVPKAKRMANQHGRSMTAVDLLG